MDRQSAGTLPGFQKQYHLNKSGEGGETKSASQNEELRVN
jgi:hypothetical protein